MRDSEFCYAGLTYAGLDQLIYRLRLWGYEPSELARFCSDLDETEGGQMKIKHRIERLKLELKEAEGLLTQSQGRQVQIG